MITTEKIKKDLELIQKKGDLYDAISQKVNAKVEGYLPKIVKTQVFFFSRILYLFLASSIKIKNRFTSVKKIKTAQDEIREYLGVPVDILRTKNKMNNLAILYGEYNNCFDDTEICFNKEVLIDHLKKIYDFGNQYEIDEFYLQQYYLFDYFGNEYFERFKSVSYSKILDYWDNQIDYQSIKITREELSNVILALENSSTYDLEFIYSLRDKIDDRIVYDAIEKFQYNKDEKKLIKIIQNRLLLYLNSETVSRNRTFGKVYETLELAEEYIKSMMYDEDGNLISSTITTLYDYLEVRNYEELMKSVENQKDNEKVNILSLLYLYLIEGKTKSYTKDNINSSFYDYIYDKYKDKKHFKKIPWIKTKRQKFKSELCKLIVGIGSLFVRAMLLNLPYYMPESRYTSFRYTYMYISSCIRDAYDKSAKFEENLIYKLESIYEKIFPNNRTKDIADYSQSLMKTNNEDRKLVAEIEWFSQEKMPVFFGENISTYGYFSLDSSRHEFKLENLMLQKADFNDVRPLFQVKIPISKDVITETICLGELRLPIELFPVGDNYLLNEIYIIDDDDPTKVFELSYNDTRKKGLVINEEEKGLLNSISSPMAYYIYGLSDSCDESLGSSISEPNYDRPKKESILNGLKLDSTASREEISQAIGEKDYISNQIYPLISGGNEYYEKVASLDYIDANLAVTLNVLANDDLYFTVGYKNADDDNKITLDEAYVWATTSNWEAVDVLANFISSENNDGMITEVDDDSWLTYQKNQPNFTFVSAQERKEQEQVYDLNISDNEKLESVDSTLEKIFAWIKNNHINYFLGSIIASLIIYHFFGKRIQFRLKLNHAHKILNDPNIYETYAQLMDYIYGGVNIPIERTEEEMITTIYKEFKALDHEEIIKEIKNEISQTNNNSLKNIYNLMNNIAFIIKEKDTLKNDQGKKLILGR